VGFESTILASELAKTVHASDHSATVTGTNNIYMYIWQWEGIIGYNTDHPKTLFTQYKLIGCFSSLPSPEQLQVMFNNEDRNFWEQLIAYFPFTVI
jgi:hypothetical protein